MLIWPKRWISVGHHTFDIRFRLQQKVFMDEVRQQTLLPTIRSYLKLYTSMPMDKLAKYMNDTTVDALESNLLCFKHKMMNLVWTKGTSGLEGEFQAESEVRAQAYLAAGFGAFSPLLVSTVQYSFFLYVLHNITG